MHFKPLPSVAVGGALISGWCPNGLPTSRAGLGMKTSPGNNFVPAPQHNVIIFLFIKTKKHFKAHLKSVLCIMNSFPCVCIHYGRREHYYCCYFRDLSYRRKTEVTSRGKAPSFTLPQRSWEGKPCHCGIASSHRLVFY